VAVTVAVVDVEVCEGGEVLDALDALDVPPVDVDVPSSQAILDGDSSHRQWEGSFLPEIVIVEVVNTSSSR
jgi:hypothetical protein